jgi:hypothetical protein
MPDLDDKHDKFAVAHLINNPVITDPDTQPAVLVGQGLCSVRARISAEGASSGLDAPGDLGV